MADGTGKPTLAEEIAALEGADKIDEELEEMKRALGKSSSEGQEG
jgi:phage shock protein A